MILSDKLVRTLLYTKEKSSDSYALILEMFNSSPFRNNISLLNEESFLIESLGSLKNELGNWTVSVKLDKSKKIDAVRMTFTGEKTTKKPYNDEYSVSLCGFNPIINKQDLVSISHNRYFNYRSMPAHRINITEKDIVAYSKPIKISNFDLTSTVKGGRITLTSNEKIGQNGYSYESTSEPLEA